MLPGPAFALYQASVEGKLPFVDEPELGPWTRDLVQQIEADGGPAPARRKPDVVRGEE